MTFFEDIRGPFKGRLKKEVLPDQGEVRVLDPTPVWVGMKDGSNIKRMMSTEDAERWIQGGVDRRVRLYVKKHELDKL